ncbi:hypothetical protein [Marinobacter sp. R17]|uniref:hypothetical protein n=1 Tax=Marinobacter sp. R17 TaxID=2484250 RepID=UPI000F4C2F86|nr:hypothetical protein [Marinobacter sp. R17]
MSNKARKKKTVAKNDLVNLSKLGFRDYVAARHLLLEGFLFQGLILSSTSVEKYVKANIGLNVGTISHLHLDKVSLLKNEAENAGLDFFSDLDDRYLELLSVAYRFRYYDDLEDFSCIGFFKWQAVGELDFTVDYIDKVFSEKSGVETLYAKAVEASDEVVLRDNYLLNGLNKKSYMERPSEPYFLGLWNDGEEVSMKGGLMSPKYNGEVCTVKSFDVKCSERN